MNERSLLMIPGPTNVNPSVLDALSKPTLSHTSPAFAAIMKETLASLGRIFGTSGLVLPLAGTGTLGGEVALANIIEPGDKVLAVSNGFFGDRLAEIARTLGADVHRMEVPWGSVAQPSEVGERLASDEYKALLVVHVDTSTGAANPIDNLGAVAKKNGALFLVDTVCSMGAMEVRVDEWGIDVCFTGSQKALAVPPGMAIISFGPRALEARDNRKKPMSTYYGDLKRWSPIMQDPTKYFATHPVNMIYGLNQSCKAIMEEGLDRRWGRHAKLASAFRASMRAVGLGILCEEAACASTLSVVRYLQGVDDAAFRKALTEDYGIVVAGGLGPLSGRTFRVGHMGTLTRLTSSRLWVR